jgi:hypothetical protein
MNASQACPNYHGIEADTEKLAANDDSFLATL